MTFSDLLSEIQRYADQEGTTFDEISLRIMEETFTGSEWEAVEALEPITQAMFAGVPPKKLN